MCKQFLAILIMLAAIVTAGCDALQEDQLSGLETAQPSSLTPDGELAKIFTYGSDYTDLQRETKLEEIEGSVVQWRLPVYEISRDGRGYQIQTSSDQSIDLGLFGSFGENLVSASVHLFPRNDAERTLIEKLKTGDHFTFKGVIADVVMRHIIIDPAILVTEEKAVVKATSPDLPTNNTPPVTAEVKLGNPASQTVATKGGVLAIAGKPREIHLLLNDRVFLNSEEYSLSFEQTFHLAEADVILVMQNSGGTACPAQFFFVVVTDTGKAEVTSEFGTCSDLFKAEMVGQNIILTMPDMQSGMDVNYTFENGIVSDAIPIMPVQ